MPINRLAIPRPTATDPCLKLTDDYPNFSILSWCRLQQVATRTYRRRGLLRDILSSRRILLPEQKPGWKSPPPGWLIPSTGPALRQLPWMVLPNVPLKTVRQRTMAPAA